MSANARNIQATAHVRLRVVAGAPPIQQIDLKRGLVCLDWGRRNFSTTCRRRRQAASSPARSAASGTSACLPRSLRITKPNNPDTNEGDVMQVRFPGESAEYRTARDRLLQQEIELRRAMEAVAVARRALPPGGAVAEDYVFEAAGPDGKAIQLRISQLFAPGKNSLVIYNFMFPRGYKGPRPGPTSGATALLPLEEGPCPSCTALLDQLDGAAEHVSQRLNLAVAAKTPLARLLTFGKERGWRHLRLLFSAGNTYNRDYF